MSRKGDSRHLAGNLFYLFNLFLCLSLCCVTHYARVLATLQKPHQAGLHGCQSDAVISVTAVTANGRLKARGKPSSIGFCLHLYHQF